MTVLLVGAGGVIGVMSRYALGMTVSHDTLPWVTVAINVAQSFLLGLLATLDTGLPPEVRSALAVGILGGFTTFSTFSVDALRVSLEAGGVEATQSQELQLVDYARLPYGAPHSPSAVRRHRKLRGRSGRGQGGPSSRFRAPRVGWYVDYAPGSRRVLQAGIGPRPSRRNGARDLEAVSQRSSGDGGEDHVSLDITEPWRWSMASVFEVRDEVWEVVAPLLPEVPEQVGPGRAAGA